MRNEQVLEAYCLDLNKQLVDLHNYVHDNDEYKEHFKLKKRISDIIFVSQDIAAYYYYAALSERVGAKEDDDSDFEAH